MSHPRTHHQNNRNDSQPQPSRGGCETSPSSSPETIEVERKFLIDLDVEERLMELLERVDLQKKPPVRFTDTYYDTPTHQLTLADHWLRQRGGRWQLKLPPERRVTGTMGVQYREVDGEEGRILQILETVPGLKGEDSDDLTARQDALSAQQRTLSAVIREQCEVFATITTERTSYQLPDSMPHIHRILQTEADMATADNTRKRCPKAGDGDSTTADNTPMPAVNSISTDSNESTEKSSMNTSKATDARYSTSSDGASKIDNSNTRQDDNNTSTDTNNTTSLENTYTSAASDNKPSDDTSETADSGDASYPYFTIDLDRADFGYTVGEIERLVTRSCDVKEALHKIDSLAAAIGLSRTSRVPGKLDEYLRRTRPEHYRALVQAGLLVQR